MYSFDQVMRGISRYLDEEIINKVNGWQKWILGTGAGLMLSNAQQVVQNLKEHELIKMLGIIDDADNVEVSKIYTELKKQAQKGPITFDVPTLGLLTLNETDVDKLYEYIKKEGMTYAQENVGRNQT
jgi:hypothetical protein